MFKKLQTQIAAAISSPESVIEKIHHDFDSASERMLQEAKLILSQSSKNVDKGERLHKLGFVSAKPVIESQEEIKKKKESVVLANHIEYYQTHYPNHKFITGEVVKSICKKYGILFGEIKYFIGDVPEKNIKDIENFVLRDEDKIRVNHYYYQTTRQDRWIWYSMCSKESPNSRYGYTKRSDWGIGQEEFVAVYDESKTHHFVQTEFVICAPKSDFDTERMRIEDGYKLVNIPDPIVLQPVKGGYLIVTKWGLEGEDKELTNEKMN